MQFKVLKNRLFLLLVVYTSLRALFLCYNYHKYSVFSAGEIFSAFLHGFRFDLATILLVNAPLVLLAILLPNRKRWSSIGPIGHWAFLILNIPFILINLIDLEYSQFSGKRISPDIFYIREGVEQLNQYVLYYWHLVLLAVLFSLILYFFSKRWQGWTPRPQRPVGRIIWSALLVVITVLGIRGGSQMKILKPIDAYALKHFDLGNLRLNSAFTMLKGGLNKGIKTNAHYFSSKKEVLEHIRPHTLGPLVKPTMRDNVVLIILESFASEFWGAANDYPGYTPFLDSLAQKGLFFKRNFSNSRHSIDALFTILFGVPSFIPTALARSNYQQNQWFGLGDLLATEGYHTSFYHGARNGSMYFNSIAGLAGLEKSYPLESYPGPSSDHDNAWGIFDGPFLQFMAHNLATYPQPFFSTVFTLTSHQPYEVPPQYKGRFPPGTLEAHETVGYVDYAVKRFFETVKKMPWFKNTLFVITGDHTQMSASEHYNTTLGRFMVPLLLYHPGRELPPADTDRVTDHTDILPSIIDYLGLPYRKQLPLFGRSVFDHRTNRGKALLHMTGNYWIVDNDYFLQYNSDHKTALLFDYRDHEQKNELHNPPVKNKMLNRIRAYIQYFRNGLIENNLYEWQKAVPGSKVSGSRAPP